MHQTPTGANITVRTLSDLDTEALGQELIEGLDSEASSVCSVYAWHQRLDGTQYESWGRYVDKLRLEDGRWRFVDRKVQMAGYRGIGDQGVPPVPRNTGPFE